MRMRGAFSAWTPGAFSEFGVNLLEGLDAGVIVDAHRVVVQADEVAEGYGRVVLLAELVDLAQPVVYLIGLGIAGADSLVVQRLAGQLLEHLVEVTQLVAIVFAGDVDGVVGGDANLVNRQTLVLQDLAHTAVVAVVLLDNYLVGDGHDGVKAQQVVADHGSGQRVHEAQHIVQRGLGGLRVAAPHDEVVLDAGGVNPLLRDIIAVILNDFLAGGLLLDKIQGTAGGQLLELFKNLLHSKGTSLL